MSRSEDHQHSLHPAIATTTTPVSVPVTGCFRSSDDGNSGGEDQSSLSSITSITATTTTTFSSSSSIASSSSVSAADHDLDEDDVDSSSDSRLNVNTDPLLQVLSSYWEDHNTTDTNSSSSTAGGCNSSSSESVIRKNTAIDKMKTTTVTTATAATTSGPFIVDDSTGNNDQGFLGDIPKKLRRPLLAMHNVQTQSMKEDIAIAEWYKEEKEKVLNKQLSNDIVTMQAFINNSQTYGNDMSSTHQSGQMQTEMYPTSDYMEACRAYCQVNNIVPLNEEALVAYTATPIGAITSTVDASLMIKAEKSFHDHSEQHQKQSVVRRKKHKRSNENFPPVTYLNEPYSLRTCIYKKTAALTEHFYNQQDVASLERFLIKELCVPEVKKTFIFWNSLQQQQPQLDPWNRSSSSLNKLSFLNVDLSNPMDRMRLPCLGSMTIEGIPAITASCSLIFETVPDSTIVYHSVIIEDPDDSIIQNGSNSSGSGSSSSGSLYTLSAPFSAPSHSTSNNQDIIVKANYSYFFKLPIHTHSAPSPSRAPSQPVLIPSSSPSVSQSVISSPLFPASSSTFSSASSSSSSSSLVLVDIELQGCLELTFSRYTNRILHMTDHVALASASSPTDQHGREMMMNSLSMEMLIKHMGYM